jgi:hypothetical protein
LCLPACLSKCHVVCRNIADYLPEMCHNAFIAIVAEFLLLPFEEGQRIGVDRAFQALPAPTPAASAAPKTADAKVSDVKGMPKPKTPPKLERDEKALASTKPVTPEPPSLDTPEKK